MSRLICHDGTTREVTPENGFCFTFEEAQKLIGGDQVEVFENDWFHYYSKIAPDDARGRHSEDREIFLVNPEKAKLRCALNTIASALNKRPVWGDVLHCKMSEIEIERLPDGSICRFREGENDDGWEH
jgi:hypothetical protein